MAMWKYAVAGLVGALGASLVSCTVSGGGEQTAAAETGAPMVRPAYMIVLGTVTDREAFMAGYASRLAPLYEKYGGGYVAIGGDHEVLEGETEFESHVISKWPGGIEDARAFWNSPEYDALRRARIDNGWGTFDVFLVEGLPETQAGSGE